MQVGEHLSAFVHCTEQVLPVAQAGLHSLAAVQSKVQVLFAPQLALHFCAALHITSQAQVAGHASVQLPPAGQAVLEQTPDWQVSPEVQLRPSSQGVPFGAATVTHFACCSTQTAGLQESPTPAQRFGLPVQTPETQ